MSKFQIFLIVLYLFFFGAVGGWVLELLFRRFFSGANPERKWLNPGFLFGPCLPLYGFGTVLLSSSRSWTISCSARFRARSGITRSCLSSWRWP